MRIVDRKTFLAMPSGTLFAKFNPHVFGEVEIKADTCGADFVSQQLIPMFGHDSGEHCDWVERMIGGESSPALDYDSYGRDGLFDEGQMFAVFELMDVKALIEHLIEVTGFAEGTEAAQVER